MSHVAGGKITPSHGTLAAELAEEVVGFLGKHPDVTKISTGMIRNKSGQGSGSVRSVKIITELGCTLVRVSQSGSVQEIRFYAINQPETRLALARFVRNNGWDLRFGKRM